MPSWRKLGIIAGGGSLPIAVAEHCAASGQDYFVARVAPFADPALDAFAGATHNVVQFAERMEALSAAGCDAVVFAGRVPRIDFSQFEITAPNVAAVVALGAAAKQGDDALLRALIALHETKFRVIGADEAAPPLRAEAGAMGAHAPSAAALADIRQAARVAGLIGAEDIGQGAVVCAGLVLAVEAQEGTDAMLARVAALPEPVRGTQTARRGVLVKRPKPTQERRIDLPTIGEATVAGAARAGLAGIAVEQGGALVMDRAAMLAAADAAGLFVYGFAPAELGEA